MKHKKYLAIEYHGTMAQKYAQDIEAAIVERSWASDDAKSEELDGYIQWLEDRLAEVAA